jgi:uncharacterized protein (DUF1499 family)
VVLDPAAVNWLGIIAGLIVLALVGFAGWVRLAPTDPARWHVDPLTAPDPATPNFARIQPGEVMLDAPDAAARLRAAMEAMPRTRLIAGSPGEGMMTFVTRSRLMGYPDYTTIRLTDDGASFAALARSRFGQSDMGVNAARLHALKDALS